MLGDAGSKEGAQLDQAAFDELVVALKAQEIVAPNLALLRRIPSVDGFDGGVLPLRRYLDMLTLFIPPDELVPDGRLREQVKRMPDSELLGLLNVQYVITDKVRDLWFEDVYYDRQIGARLGETELGETVVEVPYPFEATHVDVIGYVDDAEAQRVRRQLDCGDCARDGSGQRRANRLPRGRSWPGPRQARTLRTVGWTAEAAASSGAVVAYRDVEGGKQEYRARLPLLEPASPDTYRDPPRRGTGGCHPGGDALR